MRKSCSISGFCFLFRTSFGIFCLHHVGIFVLGLFLLYFPLFLYLFLLFDDVFLLYVFLLGALRYFRLISVFLPPLLYFLFLLLLCTEPSDFKLVCL